MKTRDYLFVLAIFIAGSLLAQSNLADARIRVELLHQARVQAALDGDYDKVLNFFAKDVQIMPGLQPPINGIAELRKMFAKDRKNGVKHHSISSRIIDDWMCGDDYYERGSWAMSVTSNDSRQPVAFNGSYFQIWQKQKDGSYKIKFNIWNLDHQP